MKTVLIMAVRGIRTHLGRFMAILLIIALSAGFFAGFRITTSAMLATGESYIGDQNFYDFRLFSTIGFDKSDAEAFAEVSGIEMAEGTYSVDALIRFQEKVSTCKLHAIPEKTNLVSLEAGRMPAARNECLADPVRYTEADIGKTFTVAQENKDDVRSQLKETEFTIVGLCNSPLYLGLDRGSTDIGSGSVASFIYIPAEAFSTDVFTEIDLTLAQKEEIYSDAYEELVDARKDEITLLAEDLVEERFAQILAQMQLTPEMAEQFGIQAPSVYVLTRDENAGYVSFENDTSIVSSVAVIFPVFFIAIAILVCVTTMSRMVDEERTQIGTLKAMGFSNRAIVGKYLIYAAIATVLGWVIGYFLCIWGLPKIFWIPYGGIYKFAPIQYVFSASLAVVTLAISLVCILGAVYIACRRALNEVPASLIRPRAGKVGKRVFLEHTKPLWNRLSFLRKITTRNMLLYKSRVIMMLVGIGCCAGLLVTAFGIYDSMVGVGDIQFNEIQKYNIEASYDTDSKASVNEKLAKLEELNRYLNVRMDKVEVVGETAMPAVNMISYDSEEIKEFWRLWKDGNELTLPGKGEALISPKVAEKFSLLPGDTFALRDVDGKTVTVTVADIFDNHFIEYVFLSDETYGELFGAWSSNSLLIETDADSEEVATKLTGISGITGVNQLETVEDYVCEALDCLNYIIALAVAFSAALAFIVIFNLTNINIAERRREIATVQVLGFYPKETQSYVLKENVILSFIASVLGLPLGKLFHMVVMGMAKIDAVTFDNVIKPHSYLLGFVTSVLFAVIVNHFMKRQITKVNMAESLKAVE